MADFAVDYSLARPDPWGMAHTGYRAAGRYLSYEPNKNLARGERDRLWAAGMSIFLVWETTGEMVLRGFPGAAPDVKEANAQADALDWPKDRPLFYAIDFEPTLAQLRGPIADYFLLAKQNSRRPVAPYGCAKALDFLCGELGIHPFGWQCLAWSYGRVSEHAALYQTPNWQRLSNPYGPAIDENEIRMPDFGQWHPDQAVAPAAFTQGDEIDMATMEDLKTVVKVEFDEAGLNDLKLAVNTVNEIKASLDKLALDDLTATVNAVNALNAKLDQILEHLTKP